MDHVRAFTIESGRKFQEIVKKKKKKKVTSEFAGLSAQVRVGSSHFVTLEAAKIDLSAILLRGMSAELPDADFRKVNCNTQYYTYSNPTNFGMVASPDRTRFDFNLT
jgi:hypothetical protein